MCVAVISRWIMSSERDVTRVGVRIALPERGRDVGERPVGERVRCATVFHLEIEMYKGRLDGGGVLGKILRFW